MTLVELLGLVLYGYVMAGALLLLVMLASINLFAMLRDGSAYRPVSPPPIAMVVGIALWPRMVKELVEMFAGQAPRKP